jgi:hypothetical protein
MCQDCIAINERLKADASVSFDELLGSLDKLLTAKAKATRLGVERHHASNIEEARATWEKAENELHDFRNQFIEELRRNFIGT